MSEANQRHNDLTRRRFLGAAAAGAGTWALGSAVSGAAAHAEASFDERVAALRAQFFTGPIVERIDLDSLDPARRPDSTQIGTIGHFQKTDQYPWITPENFMPFVVAAGMKWVRTGFEYRHWDWAANQPTEVLRKWVTADLEAGVRPLFTISNDVNVGTPKEISGWVDMVRAAIGEWGEDVGVFMFGNEPGNQAWKKHYGGNYAGGPWVEPYARFVVEGAKQLKADHPNVLLVNGVQVEEVAITQLKQSSPLIDALCMHHYTHRQAMPPDYNPRTNDPKFPDFATSDSEFERTMADYLRQGRMLLGKPDLQLWMTEIGIPSLSHREFPEDTLEPMSRTQQAKDVARMLVLGFLTVTKTFIYTLADQGHSPGRDNDNFGMIADDLTPKPSYFVYARISALTGGQATPDPAFHAVPTKLHHDLPMYVKEIGGLNRALLKERLRVERFTTADGRGLVAIWSTHPPREQFRARRTTFAVNKTLGTRPILVDPMTGGSRHLPTHRGAGDTEQFTVDVRDYPQFILTD